MEEKRYSGYSISKDEYLIQEIKEIDLCLKNRVKTRQNRYRGLDKGTLYCLRDEYKNELKTKPKSGLFDGVPHEIVRRMLWGLYKIEFDANQKVFENEEYIVYVFEV